MKFTKSQNRRLRKKLKVKSSYEDMFVRMYIDDIKRIIGDKIRNAKSMEEVNNIIDNIDMKELRKHVRALKNKIKKRNDEGIINIVTSIRKGMEELSQKKKDIELFSRKMSDLVRDKKLTDPLLDIFEKNMLLIKDLPAQVYDTLKKGYLAGKSFRGTEIEKELYKHLDKRAKLIVRTESSKVNSALTEVRSKSIGVVCYIWSTSEDQRVRDTHSYMDKVLVFYDDAPKFVHIAKSGKRTEDIHHAGNIYNCRCVMLPVFKMSNIQFPVKVAEHAVITAKYINSKKTDVTVKGITSYNKSQFLKKYGKTFSLSDKEMNKLLSE